jgi:hypothetical protein
VLASGRRGGDHPAGGAVNRRLDPRSRIAERIRTVFLFYPGDVERGPPVKRIFSAAAVDPARPIEHRVCGRRQQCLLAATLDEEWIWGNGRTDVWCLLFVSPPECRRTSEGRMNRGIQEDASQAGTTGVRLRPDRELKPDQTGAPGEAADARGASTSPFACTSDRPDAPLPRGAWALRQISHSLTWCASRIWSMASIDLPVPSGRVLSIRTQSHEGIIGGDGPGGGIR